MVKYCYFIISGNFNEGNPTAIIQSSVSFFLCSYNRFDYYMLVFNKLTQS